MNHYYDRNRPTDEQIDRAVARLGQVSSRNRLESILEGYFEYGYTKAHAIESIVIENLRKGIARGNGNAATRRLRRLQDQAEAEQITADWYDANRLSEADVDNLAAEWEYRHTHEV